MHVCKWFGRFKRVQGGNVDKISRMECTDAHASVKMTGHIDIAMGGCIYEIIICKCDGHNWWSGLVSMK